MSDAVDLLAHGKPNTPCAEEVEVFGPLAPLVQRLDEAALNALCDRIERAEGLALSMEGVDGAVP